MGKWTPGEPYRPLSLEQESALRAHAASRETNALLDQRETQAEADGLACPRCDAPIGQPCFGPGARSNHPMRAIAHYSARVQARNEGRITEQKDG